MANLVLGTNNTENGTTELTTTSVFPTLGVDNPQGIALDTSSGTGPALSASTGGGTAAWAFANGPSNLGAVYVLSQNGDGVQTVANGGGTALNAWSRFGTAVLATAMSNNPGVVAHSTSGTGVQVDAPGGTGIDVRAAGSGVFAVSDQSAGVMGASNTRMGVIGITSSPSSWGGVFWGGLLCASGPKNAAVLHPDGAHRLLYSVESPESWFEDFGRAKLVRGKTRVRLDRTFAALVRTGDYHVFLSPEGECKGLYVTRRTGAGFEVREQGRGISAVAFSYRVVARRKDIRARRFQKITLPNPKDLLKRTSPRIAIPKLPQKPKLLTARKGS